MTTAMGKVLADWASGADPSDLPIPCSTRSPIPFHNLMRHAPNALLVSGIRRDDLEKQR